MLLNQGLLAKVTPIYYSHSIKNFIGLVPENLDLLRFTMPFKYIWRDFWRGYLFRF